MSNGEKRVVALSAQQWMQIEMICTDDDPKEALRFLKELRDQIRLNTIGGLKSHLDK